MILKDKAYIDYKNGMKYKDIAKKYNVSLSTVKSWKQRNCWSRDETKISDKKALERRKMIESVERSKLTEKMKMFCIYYVDCMNATQAYIDAYHCKRTTAASEGYNLLAREDIRAEIKHLKKIKADNLMLSKDDIVERQMRIAFADLSKIIRVSVEKTDDDEKYNTLLIRDLSDIDSAVIKSVKPTKGGLAVELQDAQKAIDWLTKYFCIFPSDKHKIDFDNRRLELEKKRLDASNGGDERVNLVVEDDI